MGRFTRMISDDGSAVISAVDSTDIVQKIYEYHNSTPVVSAALGRLATACSLIGYSLKNKEDKITLTIKGKGPCGSLVAVSGYDGNVKAYVDNPNVNLPLNSIGKLDVKNCIGAEGFLTVIKDIGLKEPYIGRVPLVSGEVAEDITGYFAQSEQIPTVCGLGVLVETDLSIKAAGGFLIQLLPFANEGCIDIIEKNLKDIKPVSTMIDEGISPSEICNVLFKGLNPQVLEESSVEYKCDCNRIRIERTLKSLKENDLREMIDEDHGCEVCCQFCNEKYIFSETELKNILQKKLFK